MTSLITSRRSLLLGLGATLIASPAIVMASSLMKVKALPTYKSGWSWTEVAWDWDYGTNSWVLQSTKVLPAWEYNALYRKIGRVSV